MSFLDIFKKKVRKSNLNQDDTIFKPKSSFTEEDNFNKSRKLLKQATALKKDNIEQSIILIKDAINVCPEKVLSDYFKLANYLFSANHREEAYSTHFNLLESFDKKDISMFNMNKSQIYDKLCALSYKDKNYLNYLKYFSLWLYNTAIASACQGRTEELLNLLNTENKMNFLAQTKVRGSFKKLNKEDKISEFNNLISEYLNNIREILTIMAKRAHELDFSNDIDNFRFEETVGQRLNRLLRKESEFMEHYRKFNSNQFELYFEDNLSPLLI
jgi:hypothetical protein